MSNPNYIRILLAALCMTLGTNHAGAQEPSGLVIENVTVIDGTGRPPIAGAFVWVKGDRIERVGRGAIEVDGDVRRIDGRGKYLIPGLMDMHVHVRGGRGRGGSSASEPGISALHGFLYSGVTTIYDAGNSPDFILELRRQERAGEIISPRIFATGGLVTIPGGHGGGRSATLVDSWPQAKLALDEHIALKPDLLKLTYDEHGWGTRPLIPILPVDLLQKVIAYYNDHGIRTTVHISNELRAREAIFAGVDTLAHPIIQSPISDRFAELMGAKKVPMVSTLTIGEGYSRLVEHPEYLDQPLYRAVMEPEAIE